MIGPDASALGFAFRLELGIRDERDPLQEVVQVLALLRGTPENCVVPSPLLEPWRPSAARSDLIRSTFASGRSILLTATTIGTSAARACEIDSRVCGMTPSSAATTRTAMSVTFAPQARISVNAS